MRSRQWQCSGGGSGGGNDRIDEQKNKEKPIRTGPALVTAPLSALRSALSDPPLCSSLVTSCRSAAVEHCSLLNLPPQPSRQQPRRSRVAHCRALLLLLLLPPSCRLHPTGLPRASLRFRYVRARCRADWSHFARTPLRGLLVLSQVASSRGRQQSRRNLEWSDSARLALRRLQRKTARRRHTEKESHSSATHTQ